MPPKPNVPLTPNVFTSRAPRNLAEIETCIAMLEDSPFWDRTQYQLSSPEIVKEWEYLLLTGQGHITITENNSYETSLKGNKNGKRNSQYQHHFHSCMFAYFVTYEFSREIIARDGLHDANMHLLKSLIAHRKQNSLPCPIAPVKQLMQAYNQAPGHGLYAFVFFVWHLEIELTNPKVLTDSGLYAERIRRDMKLLIGDVEHYALIANVYSEFFKNAYTNFGNSLLREYPGNEAKESHAKTYLFCLTKNREISELLGIPDNVQAGMENRVANSYQNLFERPRKPLAGLTEKQQHACYLIVLGFTPEQIAKAMFPDSREILSSLVLRVGNYQRQACGRLSEAGYDVESEPAKTGNPRYSREKLRQVILNNLHEVRSYIFPLYPWPDGVYLPE